MTSLSKHQSCEHTRGANAALLFALLAALLAAGGLSSTAHAQLNSNTAGVNLNAVLTTALSVSAAPGLVNFALVRNGIASGSSTINVTTSWTLSPGNGRVTVWAYFVSPPSALSDGTGDNIPSANVSGSPNGGPFTPFTGAGPFAGSSSLQIVAFRVLGFNKTGTRSDNLDLRIDTTGLNLPAGTYTGILHIQAQAL